MLLNLQMSALDKTITMPEPVRIRLARAASAAQQLQSVIEGLLEYTRAESGRIALRRQSVDLAGLVRETMEEYRLHLDEKPVVLRVEIADPPPPPAPTDPRLLKVVLGNLIGNAIKFTERGTITVRLQVRDERFLIEVEDTGLGIAPEEIDKIFEPFERLEPLHRKSTPGIGLGLTLVCQLVQTLDGTIEVTSQTGVGSTFRVLLPIAPPDAHDHNDEQDPA